MPSSWKPYAFASAATLASVALTRFTWPLFSAAPFAPVFGAVAASAHWGSGGAGVLATAISAIGLALSMPATTPFKWTSPSLVIFVAIALTGTRLIAGRNRAVAALRASETELRTTLDHVRATEHTLLRAQKMEVVGQLAAGVAHNFNNLLQVTLGYTDILLDGRRNGEIDKEAVAEIRKATERGAALTRQLLAFGRRHDARAARVDLDVTIDGMREMLRRVVREDIQLSLSLREGTAVVVDPIDLEQVVLNLVLNARDALPAGGTVAIDVDRVDIDASNRPPDHAVAPGEYARLRVRDNGVGMTADVQAHLFEPFFTTKEVGSGTGLGLPFVHGIARQGGGFVTVESAPRQGTTVAVHLPLAPAAAVPAPPAPRAVPPRLAKAAPMILLVEDEDSVRFMTGQLLTRAGFRVVGAASPQDACALFDVHIQDIDLLLTDVVMAGMHGPELAERLLEKRPELPVVFVSGYSDVMPTIPTATARMAFVPKPFTAETLVDTVERLLALAMSEI